MRVKVLALALGAAGVGIFSLLLQVNLTATGVISMSLAVPIINLGRPSVANEKFAEAGAVAGTALALVAFNTLVVLFLGLAFGDNLLRALHLGELDPWLVWPILLSAVFAAFGTTLGEGMTFLTDRFDAYVRVGVAAAAADMIATVTAAWFFGLRGAILAVPIGSIVLVAGYVVFMARDRIARQVLARLSLRLADLPRLLTYSAMMYATVALTNAGLTFARAKVLVDAGAGVNGYLQTVTAVSAYIVTFVTTGFWGHMHSRAAAEGDTRQVRAELHQALRLGLLISFTGCGTAVVLADYLIPLFYSHEFAAAAPLMFAYMPGELCYQLLYLLISYQLTISRRRRYLAWNLGYIGLLTAIGLGLIPHYGAAGYVAAHVGASVVMLGIAAGTCWRTGQVRLRLLRLAGSLAALLAVISGVLIWLHWHRSAGPIALLGLIPVGITGAIAARELLSGFKLRRGRRTNAN